MVDLAYRVKGPAGITLVTDAMEAMGMPPGSYRLGDREVRVTEERAELIDGTLAGSILEMDAAVRNVMAFTGCSLAQAVTMATRTPAQVLGLEHKGAIASGYDADLVILDPSLQVSSTFIGGKLVYHRES
jgi:N-acetylglucosamine-6-phosphate deacetylase